MFCGVVNCICGALTINTPGVQVRLEYPRQVSDKLENSATNKISLLTTFVIEYTLVDKGRVVFVVVPDSTHSTNN